MLTQPAGSADADNDSVDLYVTVTNACNLTCFYCWYTTGAIGRQADRISPEHLRAWLRCDADGTVARSVAFTGGEPLLRSDFREFLELCAEEDVKTTVMTNGTLVNESWAVLFRDVGSTIHISLDSVDEPYHGWARGHHAETLRGIRHLARYGVPAQIVTVLTRGNTDQVPKLDRFALDNGLHISFQLAALPADHPLALQAHSSPEEQRTLLRNLVPWATRLNKKYYIGLLSLAMTSGSPPPLSRCPFATSSLCVDPGGGVRPCFQRWDNLGGLPGTPLRDALKERTRAFETLRPGSCLRVDCLGVF